MIRFFPESTLTQLEYEKVKALLAAYCRTEFARHKADNLRIHTKKEFIETALQQSHEFKLLMQQAQYFPNDFILNLHKELKLIGIPGAVLSGEQFLHIRKLANNTGDIFRWFDNERRVAYPALAKVVEDTYYEKMIIELIDDVLDETGNVKDSASEDLGNIRMSLYRKRNELRRVFDRIVSKLNKQGYLADIEESFMNGRRVLAVFAEQKRMIKGILHGESDSRKTTFIEPEETTGLNNDIFSLENDERKEVYRILRTLTQKLSVYASLLKTYHDIAGEFDFIRAKAKLAIDVGGNYPQLYDTAHVNLIQAYHPLLLLYNQSNNKPTIPVDINLNDKNRILVISGPNAGGKTVTLKTVGLLQLMLQSGLLVPVHPNSEMGIFKQIMIHIGDTQSLEFELSTYSSHLKNMKHFMENANGKTLFFIDELGSGSDPNLGGAFAEVIMEELAHKHAFGIVTTHYLNLKVMANKVPGIINGAMQFDENNLLPLYKLIIGKPGSSYTFSIAERIGLEKRLIEKARKLVDEDHFSLDKLLNRTEQDLQIIDRDKTELQKLIKENERLKKEMQQVLHKEKHLQEIERLRHQNKISEEKLSYLKDMERRLKSMVIEWRKAEDKGKVVQMIHALLFNQKEKFVVNKQQKKLDEKFKEVGGEIVVGAKVKMKQNRQVAIVKEIRGKKAVVQLGLMPMTVELSDLVAVIEKTTEA
ncbi:MAG TPA: MutS2/Smr-associated SH3 domain-containing protein [Ferruginibacter sp.]|jgi:DNA mismatch repair protein MutS2|nr:MutS2/Smr-associated SH3 domain-containing protein [Ferruginibacter sp.]